MEGTREAILISNSSFDPSPLHHTFLLGRASFTAQPLSALINIILPRFALGVLSERPEARLCWRKYNDGYINYLFYTALPISVST